jgi:hypothetical protein
MKVDDRGWLLTAIDPTHTLGTGIESFIDVDPEIDLIS